MHYIAVIGMLVALSGAVQADPESVYADPAEGEFFKEWLVCGPFPNPLPPGVTEYRHDETSLGYYKDYLTEHGGEAQIQPADGMEVTHPDGTKRVWKPYRSGSNLISFEKIFEPNDAVVAYAAAYVEVSQPREMLLAVGSNDGIKVWLDGTVILDHNAPGSNDPDRDFVDVQLDPGRHLFLVKVSEGRGNWNFHFRFADRDEMAARTRADFANVATLSVRKPADRPDHLTVVFGDRHKLSLLGRNIPARLTVSRPGDDPVLERQIAMGEPADVLLTSLEDGPYIVKCSARAPWGPRADAAGFFYKGDVRRRLLDVWAEASRHGSLELGGAAARALNELYEEAMTVARGYASKREESEFVVYRYAGVLRSMLRTMDNVESGDQAPYTNVWPPLRSVDLREGEPFRLGDEVVLFSKPQGRCSAVEEMLCRTIRDVHRIEIARESIALLDDGAGPTPRIVLRKGEAGAEFEKRPDPADYSIEISADEISITAADYRGHAAALYTLIDLFEVARTLPPARIVDGPEFPIRAAYMSGPAALDDATKERLTMYARYKYSHMVIESGAYYRLDDERTRQNYVELFGFVRALCMEPVPLIQSFGHGSAVFGIEPMAPEGVLVERERLRFKGDLLELDKPMLLLTAECRPKMQMEDGTTLEEGRDYQIASTEPPTFKRVPDGRVPHSGSVLLTYDYIDRNAAAFFSYCPSEPRVYEIVGSAIRNTVEHLKPAAIHIGHDEIGLLNSDSRCLARGVSNETLVVDEITRLDRIAKDADPSVRLHMWADMLTPLHNASPKQLDRAAEKLPRDIVMCDWWYSSNSLREVRRIADGIRFFTALGFDVTGSPWYDIPNHDDWVRAAVKERGSRRPGSFIGMFSTTWSNRLVGAPLVSQANWTGETFLAIPDVAP